MFIGQTWMQRCGNVLGNSQHHAVVGTMFAVHLNRCCRNSRHRRVQMDLRAGKTVGELLWNGRDSARWNDHLAVRHAPHAKSANAIRSDSVGSKVMPAKSGSSTLRVDVPNRRARSRRGWWVSDGPWTVRGLFLTWKDAIEEPQAVHDAHGIQGRKQVLRSA